MTNQRRVIVIGGGFAGLAAATAVAERGISVVVVEGRAMVGGRAYSFRDAETGDTVDNGQHIMMGCYHETIRFLRRLDAEAKLKIQNRLALPSLPLWCVAPSTALC